MIRRKKPIRRSGIKRRPPRKKRAKSELVAFKKVLWPKVAFYVKLRDGDTCFSCGATGLNGYNRQAGHLFSASLYSALRWCLDAIFVQCARCNIFYHGSYVEYHQRYIERFGQAAYDALYARRRDPKKWTLADLKEVEAEVDRRVKELNGNSEVPVV